METNLEKIKEVAKVFLNVDIAETGVDIIASHPFINTWITVGKNSNFLYLKKGEDLKEWRSYIEEKIDSSDLLQLFMMMNTPYILNFLKYVERFMSRKDLGRVLAFTWTNIEQISIDISISTEEIIAMFKRADRKTLMEKEERYLVPYQAKLKYIVA